MNNPFRKGELKAKMKFCYTGELRKVLIRQTGCYETGNLTPVTDTHYVIMQDGEGLQMSLFRRNSTYDRAEAIAAKIPTGKTLCIEGNVKAKGTHIYFEASTVCWPNGDSVLVWAADV
jgi:hypothetical protein